MSFDLQKILESKRAFRKQLAALPLAEKLRLLDACGNARSAFGRSSHPAKWTVPAFEKKPPTTRWQIERSDF